MATFKLLNNEQLMIKASAMLAYFFILQYNKREERRGRLDTIKLALLDNKVAREEESLYVQNTRASVLSESGLKKLEETT